MGINFPGRGDWASMPENRKKDMRWSDKFIPEIKQILIDRWLALIPPILARMIETAKGDVLSPPKNIDIGNFEQDNRGIDMLTFMVSKTPIYMGLRIKRENGKPHNFGIRTSRISGVKTEYDKMKEEDLLTLYFYGWAFEDGKSLTDWHILDVAEFKKEGWLDYCKETEKWCEYKPPFETKAGYVSLKQAKNCILCSMKEEVSEEIELF